jgi:hypothetical protein
VSAFAHALVNTCFFWMALWLNEINMWICMVYFHEEEDVLIDYGHQSFKMITQFLIWNLYTPLLPCCVISFFLTSFFFCLNFFHYLKIHIVDHLMHLQWPFACKNRIHQGKCNTNNWWMVHTKNEAFKKIEIQWIWALIVRKTLHLSFLCTSVLVV